MAGLCPGPRPGRDELDERLSYLSPGGRFTPYRLSGGMIWLRYLLGDLARGCCRGFAPDPPSGLSKYWGLWVEIISAGALYFYWELVLLFCWALNVRPV